MIVVNMIDLRNMVAKVGNAKQAKTNLANHETCKSRQNRSSNRFSKSYITNKSNEKFDHL